MAQVFLSYRRSDSQSNTDRIYEKLALAFGKRAIFKDVSNIVPGEDFTEILTYELHNTKVVLVIIGTEWANGATLDRLHNPKDYVRIEVETALTLPHVRVLPILVDGATMPDAAILPDTLRELTKLHALPVRNDPDFSNDIQRLIRELQRVYRVKRTRSLARYFALLLSALFLGLLLCVVSLMSFAVSQSPLATVTPIFIVITGQTQQALANLVTLNPTSTIDLPVETSTPNPQLPIKAFAPDDREHAVRMYTSLWSLTDFQDVRQPMDIDYQVEIDADKAYRWAFFWCEVDERQLEKILEPIRVRFFIDGIPLSKEVLQSRILQSDGICEVWETIVWDWQPQKDVLLTLEYRLVQSIYQVRPYEAGLYRHKMRVIPKN